MIRQVSLISLALLIAAALCIPLAGAADAPDYGKILQIKVHREGSTYSVSSVDTRYGKAPSLNFRSGLLTASFQDAQGKDLTTFAVEEPGVAYGDILGPPGENSLVGYVERPVSSDMTITAPYSQGMEKFVLADSRTGAILLTADLNPALTGFCTDYSQDPDCLARTTLARSAAPDSGLSTALAAVFGASVLLAAGFVLWNIRKSPAAQIPPDVPAPAVPQAPAVPVRQTVLIVDDDPDIVNLIDIFLKKKEYATIRASSGRECLDVLRKQIPDVILLDVRMEPMSGWETLEQIKKDAITKAIPVLMLTGKRLTAAEAKQYKICIDDYLMKPFTAEGLYEAISNTLTRKKHFRESLALAKEAGVDKDKFCEFARLSRRISVNRRLVDILQDPEGTPMWADASAADDKAVIQYINGKTRDHEVRAEQLRSEINRAFRSKGLPEIDW